MIFRSLLRKSHSLAVPYNHAAASVTEFINGIPATQVRTLDEQEKHWDVWTSSEAFSPIKQTVWGFMRVPFGESWVLQNRKVYNEGIHFFAPGKVAAIKSVHKVSFGVVSPPVKTGDGKLVNAYAVVYFEISDPIVSAFFKDPENNRVDSERAAAKIVKKGLLAHVANYSLGESNVLSAKDSESLSSKILSSLKEKEAEFGLKFEAVEIRGAFPVEQNIRDKLRALDPPLAKETDAGHGLSNDYWADVINPPFFVKRKFGNRKEASTPAAVSLEWCIPSPPDYHHFNELPKLTVDPADAPAKKVAAH